METLEIRLTNKGQYTQEEFNIFLNKIREKGVEYGIVLEDEDLDNIHYHGYVSNELNIKTLRSWFKIYLHCKGPHHYFVKSSTIGNFEDGLEGYKRYICKGSKTTDAIIPEEFYGITKEQVLKYHYDYHCIRKARRTGVNAKRYKDLSELKQKVLSHVSSKFGDNRPDKYDLLDDLIDFFCDYNVLTLDSDIIKWYYYSMNKLWPETRRWRAINIGDKII